MSLREEYDGMHDKVIKQEYEGRVISVIKNCDCELCKRGEEKLEEAGKSRIQADRWHIQIEPITVYDTVQHEWITKTKTKQSKYGVFVGYLLKADPDIEKLEDMVGRAYNIVQGTVEDLYQELMGKEYKGNRGDAVVQVFTQRVE